MIYHAYQLFHEDEPPPPLFDRALTIHGMLSHGRKRFPLEWNAVLASPCATQRLFEAFFVEPMPDDGMRERMIAKLMPVVAGFWS